MVRFFKAKLKRELGLFHTTAMGVGIILGAGIYVLLGEASGYAGNSVWLSFLVSAAVAIFTGFGYAELSSMFPQDSAEYTYTEKAFGRMVAFFIGYFVLFSAIISCAAVAIGFAGYFEALFGIKSTVTIAVSIILVFAAINLVSLKGTSWINVIFTLIGIFGLFVVIGLGFGNLGSVDYLDMPQGFHGVFKGAALVFFAFLGFESVVKMSEECKDPRKTIPKALLLSILITTILYVLVAISVVSVLDWQVLSVSKAPLADVVGSILGNNAFLILSVVALFPTASTVLITIVAGSRALYGIGENYALLKPFTVVHKKFKTPYVAVLAVSAIAILFTLLEDIGTTAELTNFTLFITFAVINAAVIFLRFKMPKEPRPFRVKFSLGKVPLVPVFGILACIFLTLQLTAPIILGGVALAASGFILYGFVMFFDRRGLRQK